jgi:predicted DsbA family dithiol-disulfide isomerase
MKKMPVVVVSDVICPWCFIGSRRLRRVLAGLKGVESSVEYRPFLLDPSIPEEGVDLRERLKSKYGGDPERMFDRVEAAAREEDIPLDFSKVRRTSSTVNAHTLIRHAKEKGTQADLADALYEAYFLKGVDIGKISELDKIALKHGFKPAETEKLLSDQAGRDRTLREARSAAEGGVEGVPFFVFGGKVAFSGAQPEEVFDDAISQALAAKA